MRKLFQPFVASVSNKILANKLMSGLIFWYLAMWAWVPFSKSTEMAGGTYTGYFMIFVVLTLNVSLSVIIIWQFIRLLNKTYKQNKIIAILSAPFVLALADFLVSWLVALFWIGPQGQADTTLPLGSPTLLVMNTPFKILGRLIGFYGIAGIVWTMVWLATKKQYKLVAIFGGVMLTGSLLSSLVYSSLKLSLPLKSTIISEVKYSKVEAIKNDSDLIIFPEYAFNLIEDDNLVTRIMPGTGGEGNFVGSEVEYKGYQPGQYNYLVFGNSKGGFTGKIQKSRLIPGGEDLPYAARSLLRITGQKDNLKYFDDLKSVNKGSQKIDVIKFKSLSLGAGLCSSIVTPHDYRRMTKNGADILSNSASLGVFSQSKLFNWQQKSLAKFDASANARYFLQSATDSSAYALDQNGDQVAEITGVNKLEFTARTNKTSTLYTKVGEWTVWAGTILSIGLLTNIVYHHRRK